jgi:hypothetical protein
MALFPQAAFVSPAWHTLAPSQQPLQFSSLQVAGAPQIWLLSQMPPLHETQARPAAPHEVALFPG